MLLSEILTKTAISLGAKVIEKKIINSNGRTVESESIPNKLTSHLKFVANWSSRIEFMVHGEPRDTDTESIELSYHGTARRFRSTDENKDTKSEADLLNTQEHYLLLGDPGSGKTTTLKRVVRKILQDEPESDADTFQYPILIRLKEIVHYHDIYFTIAEVLGFETKEVRKVRIIKKEVHVLDENGDVKTNEEGEAYTQEINEEEIYYQSEIGGLESSQYITNFLDETMAVVLIDGLDELDDQITNKVINDINVLALTLTTSKLLLTCRSGQFDDYRKVEGFNLLEILPLEASQIKSLSALWLENPEEFEKELESVPYSDLTDRPLLLSQLILIYTRYGNLPKQPKEVYQLIVELLLKEWDADNSVKRRSKYSDFNPKMKAEFLSELSFHLMYLDKKLQFDSSDLVRIYNEICPKFGLPKDEAKNVASEIESHTGILVNSGYKKYEFSHLSLHEYLCAEYIVRSPLTSKIRDLISTHPEPIAIAISLASDSAEWFNALVVDNTIFDVLQANMPPFIRRLVLERPNFGVSEILGFSVFNLFYSSYSIAPNELKPIYEGFFKLTGIRESVRLLLLDRNLVKIARIKPRSRQLVVSYKMQDNFVTGVKYTKSFPTSTSDLSSFFDVFGVKFKSSYIS